MTHEELKDLEKNALDWYSRQPMGSAVRQNGPAAIQGYMAGAADTYKQFEASELERFMERDHQNSVKIALKEKERYDKAVAKQATKNAV